MQLLDTKTFINRAKLLFGDYYNYDECVYEHSLKKVHLKCPKHGSFYIKPSNHINNNQGCFDCGKEKIYKSNRITFDEFINCINKKNNFNNYDFKNLNGVLTLREKRYIICNKHGKYLCSMRDVKNSNFFGCKKCKIKADTFTTEIFVEKSKKIHKYLYNYDKTNYTSSHFPIIVTCSKHGDFEIMPYMHIIGKGFCPKCSDFVSSHEIEIQNFLKQNNVCYESSYHKLKDIKEIDIISLSDKIGIEINGLYWHSEIFKNKSYHLNKTKIMNENGFRLVHIFEDEWVYKKDICKSILLNIFNKTKRSIFARNCTIKEISYADSKVFLNENHIQGNCISKFKFGLFFDEELVSVMTFSKGRISLGSKNEESVYELTRFCNKLNTIVVGGASKLFKHFIRNKNPKKIISYCDRRWNTGNLYKKLNFIFVKETRPNYFYVKNGKRYNRFTFRKDKLVTSGNNKNKTESEIMKSLGFNKIFDCGCFKFEWAKD